MYEPDVLVLAPDVPDIVLVAEVKSDATRLDWGHTELQIKDYMLGHRCALAILVTPTVSRLYKDSFIDTTPASILTEGEYQTSELLDIADVPTDHAHLEEVVRDWLTRLAGSWASALPARDGARQQVVEQIVPAVVEGRVMSGSHE